MTETKIATCIENLSDTSEVKECGGEITNLIEWADTSRPEYLPTTEENPYKGFIIQPNGQIKYTHTYPHSVQRFVCDSCATAMMTWSAAHLSPRRTPIVPTPEGEPLDYTIRRWVSDHAFPKGAGWVETNYTMRAWIGVGRD